MQGLSNITDTPMQRGFSMNAMRKESIKASTQRGNVDLGNVGIELLCRLTLKWNDFCPNPKGIQIIGPRLHHLTSCWQMAGAVVGTSVGISDGMS
jgi:hypothetical protein